MIDIVIPLGSGSHWHDNELRLALRSVQKNVSNYRNVIIVGRLPKWCKNVQHVPFTETQRGNPDLNIMLKIMEAFKIVDKMFFMNDDHYIMEPIDASAYPYYYDAKLSDTLSRRGLNAYGKRIFNTLEHLALNRLPCLHYDIHCPIIYKKEDFVNRMANINFTKGYIIKSLYANHETNIFKMQDAKSNKIPNPVQVFSSYPHIPVKVQNWLFTQFPNKSIYE